MSLLLVEDDPLMVRTMSLLLARGGFRVRIARSVAEAARLFVQEPPAVVLADYYLAMGETSERFLRRVGCEQPTTWRVAYSVDEARLRPLLDQGIADRIVSKFAPTRDLLDALIPPAPRR